MRNEAKLKTEPINVLQSKADAKIDQLRQALDGMAKRLQEPESQLKEERHRTPSYLPQRPRCLGRMWDQKCYMHRESVL